MPHNLQFYFLPHFLSDALAWPIGKTKRQRSKLPPIKSQKNWFGQKLIRWELSLSNINFPQLNFILFNVNHYLVVCVLFYWPLTSYLSLWKYFHWCIFWYFHNKPFSNVPPTFYDLQSIHFLLTIPVKLRVND